MSEAHKSMLDIRPGRNHGAENHQAEGEKCHSCNSATEPENLSVSNQDDSQILEDRVDRDGEILQSFCARIYRAD